MVTIRIDARCIACDGVEMLDQFTEDDGVEYIICGYCGYKKTLEELQDILAKDYHAFLKEGVKAIAYKKGGWFM